MILLIVISLFTGSIESSETPPAYPNIENTKSSSISDSILDKKIQPFFHRISQEIFYLTAGTAFRSASLAARLGWGVNLVSPWDSTFGNECLLLSQLCSSAAHHAFTQMFKTPPGMSQIPSLKKIPPSQWSWHLNQNLLSQIPASSEEDQQLLVFLTNRWLAKSTGFFSSMINWIYPCFGVTLQIHPETTNFYARNPSIRFPQAYKNREEVWKRSLPHPLKFPLILTRPCDLQDYLPSCVSVPQGEEIHTTVEKIALKMQKNPSKVVVDLTQVIPLSGANDRRNWLKLWNDYQNLFSQACKEHKIDADQILCIQKLPQNTIGGIRLLPLAHSSDKKIDQDHMFLVEWVSAFGLSANRVELDRAIPPTIFATQQNGLSIPFQSKEDLAAYVASYEQNWHSAQAQKTLMIKGTLQVLKGLLDRITKDKWNLVARSPTRSAVAQLSFFKIKEQLDLLAQKKDDILFFDTVSHLELIHAHLSSLLEIFSPFYFEDFPAIYRNLLVSIPPSLKSLTSCGIHSSGMTSIAGIFKAVGKTIGNTPRILYGENTYFECINAAKKISHATSIDEATEDDWEQVDLILAQFNPALKRIELPPTVYRLENISEILHRSLAVRKNKPLTIAIDCTLDFIDSPRMGNLLQEFQKEIENGILNVVCYRSGLKFDLFGMDNYCGAPFYMIHSSSPTWAFFDALLTDPVLQTDKLSLNWFCAAYQTAAPQLEQYRSQVFENTRTLLNKVPMRLLHNKKANYRIVPMEQGVDPSFIDIKISGPFHQIRGAALVGGTLTMQCMENGHPVFYRPGIGFYHTNFTMIFGEEHTTIRLTLGLDPSQVDLLARCFEKIDKLNGPPSQTMLEKVLQSIPSLSLSSERKSQITFN